MAMAQVTEMGVTDTPSPTPSAVGPAMLIRNMDGEDSIYVGFDNTVHHSNGFPIRAGKHLYLPLDASQAVWLVKETSTSTNVRVIYFD